MMRCSRLHGIDQVPCKESQAGLCLDVIELDIVEGWIGVGVQACHVASGSSDDLACRKEQVKVANGT